MIDTELTRDDINVIKVPINDIASEIGNPKSANIVALGVALKYIDSVSLEDIKEYLGKIFKGSAVEKNKEALQTGYNYK
jgi:2-oxoglutarate ferredoxin oxidoreductase subunit gamma